MIFQPDIKYWAENNNFVKKILLHVWRGTFHFNFIKIIFLEVISRVYMLQMVLITSGLFKLPSKGQMLMFLLL